MMMVMMKFKGNWRCQVSHGTSTHKVGNKLEVYFVFVFSLNLMYKTKSIWLAQVPVILMPKLIPDLSQVAEAKSVNGVFRDV
jgi:hypothetical protein